MMENEQLLLLEQLSRQIDPEQVPALVADYHKMITKYNCALREVRTKFEVLNDELSIKSNRNPIHAIHTRIKNPKSIMDKLARKNLPFSLTAVQNELNDVAGIRVICDFVDDIYEIAEMLLKQDDIRLIQCKDYIRNPKPNGYRSYHMIIEIPVFFSDGKELLKVEVQLRTIAMDFWASLEHEMKYKKDLPPEESASISNNLLECATTIAKMDANMQEIKNKIYPR
ncbi:MAG: GTP pyrophosphokinase family protein [Lachnospiraceae bacterium]|nr:GTP pyrophosphokinase family protein [Lachnospiraceae bacterium]